MTEPSLQDGIDQAGSPIALLWRPEPPAPWRPPVLPPEFVGWRTEQSASFQTASLMNMSHHMLDLFIKGPDATKLLSDYTANNYEKFAVGQAKQLVAVTERGHLIQDAILFRNAGDSYTVTGQPPSPSWLRYHAERGSYKVELA